MKAKKIAPIAKPLDPVLPDQGGRSMPVDPPRIHASREERIRRRAYEIYLQRGGRHGNAEQDWLQAEADVTAAH